MRAARRAMPDVRVHLRIHGRVQGVWYRGSMQEEALQLGLTGWVRNHRDGTVEAVVEGDETLVNRLVDWCHEGPPAARVTRVDVEREEPTGEFHHFGVV